MLEIGHDLESLPVPFSLSLNVREQQGPGPPQTERLHYSVSATMETELFRAFAAQRFSATWKNSRDVPPNGSYYMGWFSPGEQV